MIHRRSHSAYKTGGGANGSLSDIASGNGKGFRERHVVGPVPVSLPTVSIVETPTDLTDADYVHGVRALREAGL